MTTETLSLQAAWARGVGFWRRRDPVEARLSRPLTERMLDLAGVGRRMRVLDVGCGRGEPAIPAAHRVGPQGSVLGIDFVEGYLELARERAAAEGLANVEFRVGDAEALEVPEGSFDVATARWLLMYLPHPEAAVAGIHRALKPGGLVAIASWVETASSYALPTRILERFRPVPSPAPGSPGMYRHSDPRVLHALLDGVGFSVEAEEELEVPILEAGDGRGIVAWLRDGGGGLIRLVDELPQEQQRAWEDQLAKEAEQYRVADKILLGGVSRITVARKRPA